MTAKLPVDRGKSLVAAWDKGLAVWESRETVATEHGVTAEMVKAIEKEGVEKSWLPLAG